MIFGDCARIKKCVIHKVGNKLEDEELLLSKDLMTLSEEVEATLLRYISLLIIKPFRHRLRTELHLID